MCKSHLAAAPSEPGRPRAVDDSGRSILVEVWVGKMPVESQKHLAPSVPNDDPFESFDDVFLLPPEKSASAASDKCECGTADWTIALSLLPFCFALHADPDEDDDDDDHDEIVMPVIKGSRVTGSVSYDQHIKVPSPQVIQAVKDERREESKLWIRNYREGQIATYNV